MEGHSCQVSNLIVREYVSNLRRDSNWPCQCALCGTPWFYDLKTGEMRRVN